VGVFVLAGVGWLELQVGKRQYDPTASMDTEEEEEDEESLIRSELEVTRLGPLLRFA